MCIQRIANKTTMYLLFLPCAWHGCEVVLQHNYESVHVICTCNQTFI